MYAQCDFIDILPAQNRTPIDIYFLNIFSMTLVRGTVGEIGDDIATVNMRGMLAAQEQKFDAALQYFAATALLLNRMETTKLHGRSLSELRTVTVDVSAKSGWVDELYTIQYRAFTNMGVVMQQLKALSPAILPAKFVVQLYEYVLATLLHALPSPSPIHVSSLRLQ